MSVHSGLWPAHSTMVLRKPLSPLHLPCYIYVLPMKKTISQTNLAGHPSIYPSVKAEASVYMHQTWAKAEVQTSQPRPALVELQFGEEARQ